MRLIVASVVMASLLAACDRAPTAEPGSLAHELDDTFTISRQEGEVLADGFGVAFLDVLEDSRCPKNVACVWQGAATVRLSMLTKAGSRNPRWLDLATAPETKRSAVYEGHRVELVDVTPYPDGLSKPAPDQFRISVRVTSAP